MRAEIVLTISIAIMYMSCVLYLQIAFWMPTLASQLWLLVCAVLAVVFASAITTPVHQWVTTALPFLAIVALVIWDIRRRQEMLRHVYDQAKQMLKEQEEKQEASSVSTNPLKA